MIAEKMVKKTLGDISCCSLYNSAWRLRNLSVTKLISDLVRPALKVKETSVVIWMLCLNDLMGYSLKPTSSWPMPMSYKRKLHYCDLLWICCTTFELLWISCGFVADLLYSLLYNKSTTNRSNGVCAIGPIPVHGDFYNYADVKCDMTNEMHTWWNVTSSTDFSPWLFNVSCSLKRSWLPLIVPPCSPSIAPFPTTTHRRHNSVTHSIQRKKLKIR